MKSFPIVTNSGQVGRVVSLTPAGRKALIQFGTDGPYEGMWCKQFARISEEEFDTWLYNGGDDIAPLPRTVAIPIPSK